MKTPLTIVFCLPGSSFSGHFLECWTNLLAWCLSNNIRPVLSRKQSCNIYFVRNMCLGASVERGPHQKPFNGQLEYEYILWIDSDILCTPEYLQMLLSHNVDIVSGIYKMEGGAAFATVKNWDEEYFKKHGCFEFLTEKDLTSGPLLQGSVQASPNERGEVKGSPLIEVSYTGMGFMLCKRGVFESMEYPWFRPIEKRIGEMYDITMEDVAFCLKAQDNGFKVYVDPRVRVGHEKKMVL